MTPRELGEQMAGFNWREQRAWEKLAWLASHLMNATGNFRAPVTVEDLLRPARASSLSAEEIETQKAELIKRLEE